MKYRAEIDGLRAFAVIPVVLFHAGFENFGGGFVGVDIFFVISGYLITSILIEDIEKNNFSLLRFYDRRARRIFPALFFVVLCCIPFALWLFMPQDMESFSKSLISVATFSSNILFWRESGYFDTAAELKPLLHTWSLAVEEQFYVIFPLFLMLSWRHGIRAVIWLLISIFFISLISSHWGAYHKPGANFYLLPTRSWELLLGSFSAFYIRSGKAKFSGWINNIFSFFGLVAIAFSIIMFDEKTPFPSAYALVPTLGTFLIIIFAVKGTWAHSILSFRIFVSIGLVSYSLYLWHQPVFAFWRHYYFFENQYFHLVLLTSLCFVLAYLTYWFIETPFRVKSVVPDSKRLFIFSACVMTFLVVFGLFGYFSSGFPMRLPASIEKIAAASKDHSSEACLWSAKNNLPLHPVSECLSEGQLKVMLIGDSHANAISDTFAAALSKNDIGAYKVSYSGCIPLLGFYRVDQPADHRCNDFVESALKFAHDYDVSTLVLMARFPLYLRGDRFNNAEGGVERGDAAFIEKLGVKEADRNSATRQHRILKEIEDQILYLAANFNVILVNPVPEAGWDVPTYGVRLALNGSGRVTLSTDMNVYLERAGEFLSLFDRLARDNDRIWVSDIQNELCDGERCYNIVDNNVLYYDDDHLSVSGAETVVPRILRTVSEALR